MIRTVPEGEYGSCPPIMSVLSIYRLRASASKLSAYFSIFHDLVVGKLLIALRCGVDYCIGYYQRSTNMTASAIAMHCGPLCEKVYTCSKFPMLITQQKERVIVPDLYI